MDILLTLFWKEVIEGRTIFGSACKEAVAEAMNASGKLKQFADFMNERTEKNERVQFQVW